MPFLVFSVNLVLMVFVGSLLTWRFKETKLLNNITLLLSLTFVALYISATFKLPLRYTFLSINLIYVIVGLLNYKKLIEFIKGLEKKNLLILLLIMIISSGILCMRGVWGWSEMTYGLFAKALWYVHGGGFENTGVLGDYRYVGPEIAAFQIQSFYWAAINSFSGSFNLSMGPIFTWLLFLIVTYLIVPNKDHFVVVLPIMLLILPQEGFANAINGGVVAVAAAVTFYALYEVMFKKLHYINLLGPSIFLCFSRPEGFTLLLTIFIAFFIVLTFEWFRKINEPSFKTLIFSAGLIVLVIIVRSLLMKFFAEASGITSWVALNLKIPPYWKDTLVHAFRYFYAMKGLILSFFVLLTFGMLSGVREYREKSISAILVLTGKFISIILVYLFVLYGPEAQYAKYFERYMIHVSLIPLLCSFELISGFKFWENKASRTLITVVSVVLIMFAFTNPITAYKSYKGAFTGSNIFADCKDRVEKGGRYQLIDQVGSGYEKDIAVLIGFPIPPLEPFTMGPKRRPGDTWRDDKILKTEDWYNFLRENKAEFIILYQDDDYFKNSIWPKGKPYPKKLPVCLGVEELGL